MCIEREPVKNSMNEQIVSYKNSLTDEQYLELKRRIEEDDINPPDVIPWEQLKIATLTRFGK